MAAYILRNIDPALWSRVKAMSEAEGIPLRAVILKLLELYGLGEVVIRADRSCNPNRPWVESIKDKGN